MLAVNLPSSLLKVLAPAQPLEDQILALPAAPKMLRKYLAKVPPTVAYGVLQRRFDCLKLLTFSRVEYCPPGTPKRKLKCPPPAAAQQQISRLVWGLLPSISPFALNLESEKADKACCCH